MQVLRTVIASPCARSFSTTGALLAIGSYPLFVKRVASRPELKGLKIGARGKLMGHWFRNLPAAEKAALSREARKFNYKYKRSASTMSRQRKVSLKQLKPTAYARFVKVQMKTPAIRRLPYTKRLSAIGKLWTKDHPKPIVVRKKRSATKPKPVKIVQVKSPEVNKPKLPVGRPPVSQIGRPSLRVGKVGRPRRVGRPGAAPIAPEAVPKAAARKGATPKVAGRPGRPAKAAARKGATPKAAARPSRPAKAAAPKVAARRGRPAKAATPKAAEVTSAPVPKVE
jgi:hypothetical protein